MKRKFKVTVVAQSEDGPKNKNRIKNFKISVVSDGDGLRCEVRPVKYRPNRDADIYCEGEDILLEARGFGSGCLIINAANPKEFDCEQIEIPFETMQREGLFAKSKRQEVFFLQRVCLFVSTLSMNYLLFVV